MRLDNILSGKPKKIFLLIGVNDLGDRTEPDTVVYRIGKIIKKIQTDSPATQIYLQSVLPVNEHFPKFRSLPRIQGLIKPLNSDLKVLAQTLNVTYIDLFSHFEKNKNERLNPDYTNDGLHLTGAGYLKWIELIKPYLKD